MYKKAATKVDVTTFISETYEAEINLENVVLENNTVSIKGPLMTSDDWNKIKANGDKKRPYRITVLYGEDKNEKAFKIAIDSEGNGTIENIKTK